MQFYKCKIGLRNENTGKDFYVDGYRMHCDLYKCDIDVVFGQKQETFGVLL